MSGGAGGAAQAGIGALQILNAKQTADAQRRQAEFAARQQEFNSQLTAMQIEDVEAIAKQDVQRRQRQLKQMVGSQKVALAAQGIEVEGELGEALEADERLYAAEDINAIKNNAWRQAMGLEIESRGMLMQAKQTRLGGKIQSRQTMATGALSGLSSMAGGFGDMYSAWGPSSAPTRKTKSKFED